MIITIRDKHTGEELFELYTDPIDINLTIVSKDGWTKPYSFKKKDYEISYIG